MTFTPLNKQERAEWRLMLAPLERTRLVAAVLLFLFSSLTLVFCRSMPASAVFLLYAVIFYYSVSHSFLAVILLSIPGVLLLPISAYCAGMQYALALPAAYAAVLLGGVGGAISFMQLYKEKKGCVLLALLPILSYLVCLFVSGSPRLSLLSLVPTGIALVLALCMLSCRPQTSGVLMLAATVALTGAVTILLTLLFWGLLDGNPLVRTVEILRAGVTRVFENAVEMQIAEGLPLQYSKLDIKNISALLGNIFPALFLVCSALLAYAMWRMMLRISVEWHILPRVPLRLAVLTVSPYAAAVFTVSFLASLLANASKLTLFGVLCENISLLLEPALALVGFSSLSPRRATSCLSHVLGIGLLVLLCYDLGSGLILASFLGAFHILWSRFAPRDKGGK